MNAGVAFNVVTIIISLLSLTVSGGLVLRQVRAAKDGYALPVVLDVFSRFRTQEFFESETYILTSLRSDIPDIVPYTDLPMDARTNLWNVAGLYDDLGKLVAHGIVSEELIIGSRGRSVLNVWEVVEPYVLADRKLKGSSVWIYLEDLACRIARNPPETVHAKLKLMRYPPAGLTRKTEGPFSGNANLTPRRRRVGDGVGGAHP